MLRRDLSGEAMELVDSTQRARSLSPLMKAYNIVSSIAASKVVREVVVVIAGRSLAPTLCIRVVTRL